jgi:esterase/lipase superfamily enzyme
MPIVGYGRAGKVLLLIPTAAADYLEYERFLLIDSLANPIQQGKIRVFSIDSINNESWLNNQLPPEYKAERHEQWNHYIFEEVIPFIRQQGQADCQILLAGASFGALHSMNLFLRRPDLIQGVIAMSGVYNLMEYTKGFYNERIYFNSPAHFLPNLTDDYYLNNIRQGKIIIASGSGAYEDPLASQDFSRLLHNKNIQHELSIWGVEWKHDWPTWREMLPFFVENSL